MAFGFFIKFHARHGQADQLESTLLEAAELMRKARGCHLYLVCRDKNDPHSVGVYELWDSPETHRASLNYPGVSELIGKAGPLLSGKPEYTSLDVKGGVGFPG